MNSCVFVNVFVLLVCGEVYGVSLCPAGHVMDWDARSCWKVSSMILDVKECKATLPELQVVVQEMLDTIGDIERQMRQLEEEQNGRFSVVNDPNVISDPRKESRKSQSDKSPTNHVLEFSKQREVNEQHTDLSKSESTYRHHSSVATSLLENEENTQMLEFTDRNELGEQEPIAQSRKKDDQMGEEQNTPIFEFSALSEYVPTEQIYEKSSVDKFLKKQNTHSSEFSEHHDVPNAAQISTENVSNAHDSKEEPNNLTLEPPDRKRIRQLEYDINLQKEKNEECAAEVIRLVDNVNLLSEENEHVRTELKSAQDTEREHFFLLSEQNALLSEQSEELEKAHFLTERCEASMDQIVGKMSMMEETLNDRDEFINKQLILIENKDDKLNRQKRVIKYLRAEISRLLTADQPISSQRFDDSSEMDELLSTMDMMEEE